MRKNFVKLLGADYYLLQKAGSAIMARFYISGIAIILIIVLTISSIRYAIDLLFHNLGVEICLSCFFASTFAIIYIFLLNTFAKEDLPEKNKFTRTSNLIRMGFVVFIAVLVAVPAAMYISKDSLEVKIYQHKNYILQKHIAKINTYYNSENLALEKRSNYCVQQKNVFHTHFFDNELGQIEIKRKEIQNKLDGLINEATTKINENASFLYRIKEIDHYPISWIVFTFFILLFLLPGYLVYSISSDNEYYKLKKHHENELIIFDYQRFVKLYKDIYQNQFDISIEIFSRFEDPPFKRIRKVNAEGGTIDQFLTKYITGPDGL